MGRTLEHLAFDEVRRQWTIVVACADGSREAFVANEVVSSAPIRELMGSLKPTPLSLLHARELKYRDFLTDRKSTRLNSSHANIYTLSLHDALPISWAARWNTWRLTKFAANGRSSSRAPTARAKPLSPTRWSPPRRSANSWAPLSRRH